MRLLQEEGLLLRVLNEVLLPLKLLIPQPIIAKIPGLTTNEEIRIQEVLRHIPPTASCLDIGCGNNRLIQLHRARGGRGIGVDVYPWEGVDLIVKDSSLLPFKDQSFDCVTFVASLNHIPNRDAVLREAFRLLKRGGTVILTTLDPLPSYLWHKWAFWDRDQHERGMQPGEVYGFKDEEIQALLSRAGFLVVQRRRFSLGLVKLYVAKKP